MTLRTLIVAALLLVGAVAGAGAAEPPPPDAARLAASRPAAYAAYRRHGHPRTRWAYRGALHHAGGIAWPWWITHPVLGRCYERPPWHCRVRPAVAAIPVSDLNLAGLPTHAEVPAPRYRRSVSRHRVAWRHGRRVVLRARG